MPHNEFLHAQILTAYSHFTQAEREEYISTRGWITHGSADNWVPDNSPDPDNDGHTLDEAFCVAILRHEEGAA